MLSTNIKRAAIILAVCASLKPAVPAAPHFPEAAPPAPLGLPPMIWPLENPYSAQKAELGWILFYDARLSRDGTQSCMSCHSPGAAFTDGRKVSIGVGGQMGTRNSPTVVNAAYNAVQLRDGRARLLETQCLLALNTPREMGLEDSTLVEILSAIPEYRKRFRTAFARDRISSLLVSRALATFERLVVSGDSAYDRFVAGDKTALTESQQR